MDQHPVLDWFRFAFSNLGIWFVTPAFIFLVLVKPMLWLRYKLLGWTVYLVTRWMARSLHVGERCLVVGLPFFQTQARRRLLWANLDHFFVARRFRSFGGWFVSAERLHPEAQWHSVERLMAELRNHFGTHYRGILEVVFNWIGFTGAVRACAPQIRGFVARRTMDELLISPVSARSERLVSHGIRERTASPVRRPGMSWQEKVEEARHVLSLAVVEINQDVRIAPRARPHAVMVEEAKIAAHFAEYAGEAVRLLLAISPDKSHAAMLEQLPFLLERVYRSETPLSLPRG